MVEMPTVATRAHDFLLEGNLGGFTASLAARPLEDGLDLITLRLEADQPASPPALTLTWMHPAVDIQGRWSPEAKRDRSVSPEWARIGSRPRHTARWHDRCHAPFPRPETIIRRGPASSWRNWLRAPAVFPSIGLLEMTYHILLFFVNNLRMNPWYKYPFNPATMGLWKILFVNHLDDDSGSYSFSNTICPSTIVMSTSIFRMSLGSIFSRFRSQTVMSASLPFLIEPRISSSNAA